MSYVPRPRKLEGDFQKTLILVNGEPLDGKTTICQKILNESLGYISFDQMIWEDDLGIVELTERKKKSDYMNIVDVAFEHVLPNYTIFLNYLLRKIDNIEKDVIILDSYYFTKKEFLNHIVSDLRVRFRVWIMNIA